MPSVPKLPAPPRAVPLLTRRGHVAKRGADGAGSGRCWRPFPKRGRQPGTRGEESRKDSGSSCRSTCDSTCIEHRKESCSGCCQQTCDEHLQETSRDNRRDQNQDDCSNQSRKRCREYCQEYCREQRRICCETYHRDTIAGKCHVTCRHTSALGHGLPSDPVGGVGSGQPSRLSDAVAEDSPYSGASTSSNTGQGRARQVERGDRPT